MTNRNVVLIVLDSVRKDFFDSYATQIRNLSHLSYEQCRAVSSWSLPSHASMLSGTLPSQHGVHTHSGNFASLSLEETFLSELTDFTTMCVSANAFASSSYGFDKYFDVFVEASETRRFADGFDPGTITQQIGNNNPRRYLAGLSEIVHHDHPLKSFANAVLGELDNLARDHAIPQPIDDGAVPVLRATKDRIQTSTEPFFAFLNIMDTHLPFRPRIMYDTSLYDVPNDWCSDEMSTWELINTDAEEYWEKREALYAAAIDYVDRKVASFIKWLQRETDRETTIIVTADHGENHGRKEEHGLVNHKSSLSEGLLHVPLEIINPPEVQEPTERYVSHSELGRLITALARGTVPDTSSKTVVAENIGMSGGSDPDSDYEYWDRALRCAYKGSEKYLWDSLGLIKKYETWSDCPSYQELLSEEMSELPKWAVRHFDTDIVTYKQQALSAQNQTDVDEATKNRLEKLGYL